MVPINKNTKACLSEVRKLEGYITWNFPCLHFRECHGLEEEAGGESGS